MKFDPMGQWGQVFETWQKMTDESIARMNAFYAELEKAEAKRIERAESTIDEVARMQKESIKYGAQLGAEWRKASLDAFQRFSSFATAAAG